MYQGIGINILIFYNSREEVNDSIMIPNIIIDQSDWLNRD